MFIFLFHTQFYRLNLTKFGIMRNIFTLLFLMLHFSVMGSHSTKLEFSTKGAQAFETVTLDAAISLKIALLTIESMHLATAVGAHAIPLATALNPMVGGAFLATTVAANQVAKQFEDRMVKYVDRVRALDSVTETSGNNDGLAKLKKLLNESNKGRVKYRCKATRAMEDAKNQSMRNALFCIYNNPMPMDYLCEFLGNLEEKQSTVRKMALQTYRKPSMQQNSIETKLGPIQNIADIITNPLIEIYRKSLKYRFLDKYYTAINDDFEGLVKIRSRVNVADRLDASEFWHADAKTNLRDILADMKQTSKLMKNINLCHKVECDTIEADEKEKDKFIDLPAEKEYQNYCEYYFRKKPLYLMDKLNIKKQASQLIHAKDHSSGYLEKKKVEREKILENATKNLESLIEQVEKKKPEEALDETSTSLEDTSQKIDIRQQLIEELKKFHTEKEKENFLKNWEKDPKNSDSLKFFESITQHLKDENNDNKNSTTADRSNEDSKNEVGA